MKQVGNFWVPNIDVQRFRGFGKQRAKTYRNYANNDGPKSQDLRDALAHFQGGKIAIDGGANVGAYTRLMLQRFDFVHAIEPAPDTFEALERNIQDWGFADRVKLYPVALSDCSGMVNMRPRLGHRSLTRRVVDGKGVIPACRLDDLETGQVSPYELAGTILDALKQGARP